MFRVGENAAYGGYVECYKYAMENSKDTPNLDRTLGNAAESGNLEMMKYALENGCEWENVMAPAISGGNIDCVKLVQEQGYAWRHNCCEIAAEWASQLVEIFT
jgi:hypothetical protein